MRDKLSNFLQSNDGRVPHVAWIGWVLVFALLAAVFPRDTSYDVAHYQLHNGWAWWDDRAGIDFAPAEMHSFFNPVFNIFSWVLVDNLPGPLVNAIIAIPQALTLPALYILTRALVRLTGSSIPVWMCLLVAASGFWCASQTSLFASVRNDAWGAFAFIAALAICIRPNGNLPGWRSLAAASLLMGLAFGMKVTNACYLLGFAALVVVAAQSHSERAIAVAVCAITGVAGMLITGGVFWWDLWSNFGNPLFPRLNSFFESPYAPTDYPEFQRRTPKGLVEFFIYPFLFTFQSGIIGITRFIDIRFLLSYVLGFVGIALLLRRLFSGGGTAQDRMLLAFLCAVLVAIFAWLKLFSVTRYMLAAWILGPTILIVVLLLLRPYFLENRTLKLGFAAFLAVLLVTVNPVGLRRAAWTSWDEPYVSAKIPATHSYENAFVIFSGPGPSAFLAPFFPETAIFGHADAQDFSRALLVKYRPRQRAAIASSDRPVFAVIATISDVEQTLKDIAADEALLGELSTCEPIETSFDKPDLDETWVVCPLERM